MSDCSVSLGGMPFLSYWFFPPPLEPRASRVPVLEVRHGSPLVTRSEGTRSFHGRNSSPSGIFRLPLAEDPTVQHTLQQVVDHLGRSTIRGRHAPVLGEKTRSHAKWKLLSQRRNTTEGEYTCHRIVRSWSSA